MNRVPFAALLAALTLASAGTAFAADLKVVSEKTIEGVPFPESVAYDRRTRALYVSEFVSALKPAEKDGQGRISKLSLDGKVLEERFLPGKGETLNKPKGIWVHGTRLWVTDIDVVWEFDTRTRKGRKIALPGAKFANDVTLNRGVLFVSDNQADKLYRVDPGDFLDRPEEPQVSEVFSGKGVNPNGVYPAGKGEVILMVGYAPPELRGIYELTRLGDIDTLAQNVGALDGLYRLRDGSLLVTDWKTGTFDHWTQAGGLQPLASGFKGPADFGIVPRRKGLLAVVPDLVQSQLRFVELSR